MNAIAQCLSHSPVMSLRPLGDARADEVSGALADARQAMAAFDPELAIVFGPDHYNGFFYDLMPPFCVGVAATGVGDYATPEGPLNVDRETAMQLHRALLASDFDIAVSHDMHIDHGFTQALDHLFGDASRAFVPVFINCIASPVASCRRAIALGTAIGRYCKTTGRRVAFIGSGGLSHDAPLPNMDSVPPELRHKLIERRLLEPAERAERETRTLDAADRFAANQPPLAPLNEAWDRGFMRDLAAGRWEDFAALADVDITREGGRSGHEIRTWLAAFAALRAFGEYTVEQIAYAKAPEWIVGYGAMRARVGK
jgi:2,3-dihydroxyphenylpropionate 1,2-dioxygenase